MVDDQPWMIVQEKVNINDKSSAFVFCDRRQHLLILHYEANKSASMSSASSAVSIPDLSGANSTRSTRTVDVRTVSKSDFVFVLKR
jgi:hypothetical protein